MKTRVTYFVTSGADHYNGTFLMRPKASPEAVWAATIKHASKVGFVGHHITVTATGCQKPMLAEIILA